ncbi:hypothetical protein M5K25_001684 [Dendrobium thyrsiflorum]|uniref:Uncharacterized protein n=1 Tax=Dendrobium thyrsiflorum TaxID=117978 RepID=A0ABD0VR68_DENTH
MTPLLSLVTYLIMSDKPFDEAQLILDYIHNLSDIRHPQIKRKKNIALGHLICYVLEKKYNLIYPEPPTEEPIFFTNASFRSLFHDPTAEGEDLEGEREVPLEPAPVPNQNAYQDMIQRFDTMKTNFDQSQCLGSLPSPGSGEKGGAILCWRKSERFSAGGRVVLCRHQGVVRKESGSLPHQGVVKKEVTQISGQERGNNRHGDARVLSRLAQRHAVSFSPCVFRFHDFDSLMVRGSFSVENSSPLATKKKDRGSDIDLSSFHGSFLFLTSSIGFVDIIVEPSTV